MIHAWYLKMPRKPGVALVLTAALLGSLPDVALSAEDIDRPNLVLIMLDDLGAEALGSYGGQSYLTPHMDALAEQGIRFDNAYTPPSCTPTRVQLMSGEYPFRTGWTRGIWHKEPSRQYVDPELLRIGRELKQVGYRTAVVGKWQLARFDEHPTHPRQAGFEHFTLWAWIYNGRRAGRYRNPRIWSDDGRLQILEGDYGPDVYTRSALEFIETHSDQRFFLYYPMTLVHRPLHNPPGYDRVTDEGKFAAMVEYADGIIGRLVAALDRLSLRRETLVVVTADNGTSRDMRSQYRGQAVRGGKGKLEEAGARVPLLASWPGTIPEGLVSRVPVDTADLLPTFLSIAGTDLVEAAGLDGRSLMPEFLGRGAEEPDWAYIQLGDRWFIRDDEFRLHSDGTLIDVRTDRYAETTPFPLEPRAIAARVRLRWAASELRGTRSELLGKAAALFLLAVGLSFWGARAVRRRLTRGRPPED